MSSSSYGASLARLLAHEGGYTNHPSDPGGPTNFGITIADYRSYVKADATAADVRAMRLDEAKAIYRSKYWDALRCDELPAGVDYAVFDFGVNSGIARSARLLQRLAGVDEDGRIGEATLAAVRKADAAQLIGRLCDERLAFLKRLKTWPVFGAGWGRRVAEVRAAALAMVAKQSVPAASKAAPLPGKSAASTSGKMWSGALGVFAAAGAALVRQAGAHPALIVFGLLTVLAGGWFAWRWYRHWRQSAI